MNPHQRAERKANLLLASELLRGQVLRDVDDVGQRADGLLRRAQTLRDWLTHPAVLAAVSGGAAFFAAAGRKRRSKLMVALRWAWMAWRVLKRP